MTNQSEALRLNKAIEFYTNCFEKTKHENRKLLELAVKAAKYDFQIRKEVNPYNFISEDNFYLRNHSIARTQDYEIYWNPLKNDGDALRLAVKLGINVWVDDDIIWCNNIAFNNDNDDPYAATRRAIVRAAAEIGKEQP